MSKGTRRWACCNQREILVHDLSKADVEGVGPALDLGRWLLSTSVCHRTFSFTDSPLCARGVPAHANMIQFEIQRAIQTPLRSLTWPANREPPPFERRHIKKQRFEVISLNNYQKKMCPHIKANADVLQKWSKICHMMKRRGNGNLWVDETSA